MALKIGSFVQDKYTGKHGVVTRPCGSLELEDDPSCLYVRLEGMEEGEDQHFWMTDLEELSGRAALEARLKAALAEADRLQGELEALPPFEAGQKVRVQMGTARGRKVVVLACEKAFGDWMAQVAFPGNDEPYTYPCSKLVAA